MDAIINLSLVLGLLIIGFVFGRMAEKRHYKNIRQQEDELRHIFVSSERLPHAPYTQHDAQLVTGSVVISVDYFKVFVSNLKTLVGGRLTAYESLLDRARRESILRMQKQAQALGAEAVVNLKFETSRISGNAGKSVGSVEVLAYGTGLIPRS